MVEFPQPSWPAFTADVTVVAPPLSWRSRYPDYIWPKRGTHVSRQSVIGQEISPIPTIAVTAVTGGRGYLVMPQRTRVLIMPRRTRRLVV